MILYITKALLVLCFLFSVIGCKKDNNNSDIKKLKELVGSWVEKAKEGYKIVTGEKELFSEIFDEEDEEGKITFNDDGSFFLGDNKNSGGTYVCTGTTITLSYNDNGKIKNTSAIISNLSSTGMTLEITEKIDSQNETYTKTTYAKIDGQNNNPNEPIDPNDPEPEEGPLPEGEWYTTSRDPNNNDYSLPNAEVVIKFENDKASISSKTETSIYTAATVGTVVIRNIKRIKPIDFQIVTAYYSCDAMIPLTGEWKTNNRMSIRGTLTGQSMNLYIFKNEEDPREGIDFLRLDRDKYVPLVFNDVVILE